MPEFTHVAPAEQPTTVPEIAGILFPAYHLDDGRVSLAGCAVEDRLVLQLVYECGSQTVEIYLNAEGKEVDGQPVAGEREPKLVAVQNPPDLLESQREQILAAGSRLATIACRRRPVRNWSYAVRSGASSLRASCDSRLRRLQSTCHFAAGRARFRPRHLSVLTRVHPRFGLRPPTTDGSSRRNGSKFVPRPATAS